MRNSQQSKSHKDTNTSTFGHKVSIYHYPVYDLETMQFFADVQRLNGVITNPDQIQIDIYNAKKNRTFDYIMALYVALFNDTTNFDEQQFSSFYDFSTPPVPEYYLVKAGYLTTEAGFTITAEDDAMMETEAGHDAGSMFIMSQDGYVIVTEEGIGLGLE